MQVLNFVGRKTAMKLSKARTKIIPNEMLKVSNDNDDLALAFPSQALVCVQSMCCPQEPQILVSASQVKTLA